MDKKLFFVIFLLLVILVSGCSKKKVSPEQFEKPPVEIPFSNIQKCYVHKDYVACQLSSGNAYYVTTDTYEKILLDKTSWDCTLWEENPCTGNNES